MKIKIEEVIQEVDRRVESLYKTGKNSKDLIIKRSCDAGVTTLVLLKMWLNSKNDTEPKVEK